MRDPWPARTSTLIFIGRTDAEAEVPILWPPDVKSRLIGKMPHLVLGKIEGRRRRGQQRMRWVDGITDSVDMNLSKFRVMVVDKMWSTGAGNDKPLQYSCLENPMNSMKKQKDRTLEQ